MTVVSVLLNIKDLVLLFFRLVAFVFRKLFWHSRNIVYINDNKKKSDLWDIKKGNKLKNYKIVHLYSNARCGASPKIHLFRMKTQQKIIVANVGEETDLMYYGYVSTPFSAYDGFIIGDNHDVTLFDKMKDKDTMNKVVFKRNRDKETRKTEYHFNEKYQEINLLVESSDIIREELINNSFPIHHLAIERVEDKITSKYLNSVYYAVRDYLDAAANANIKCVHLYCNARQAVSFVVGQAIQPRHPNIKAYEFYAGSYKWSLDFEKGKIFKLGKKTK